MIQSGLSVAFVLRKTATKPAEISSPNTTSLLYCINNVSIMLSIDYRADYFLHFKPIYDIFDNKKFSYIRFPFQTNRVSTFPAKTQNYVLAG